MKSMMSRFIKPILGIFVIVFAVSCEDGNEIFDQIQAEVQRGAVLRTVELISNELPIGQSDARFAVTIEEQDQQGGDLLQQVDVFVGFRDNVVPMGGTDKDFTPTLYATIPASDFSTGPFGLPRYTFEVTLNEMLAHTGVTEADLFGGDQFEIRFELVLTDGRRFTNTDNSGTITGSFYSSPFLYTPTIICPIPEGNFTGTYNIVQDTPGIFGAIIADGAYEIMATSGTSRDIPITAYPQFGGFARNILFDMVCGDIKVVEQDMALTCGGPNIVWREASVITTYDPNDDSSFTIQIYEAGGGCGADADNVTLTLTKQ